MNYTKKKPIFFMICMLLISSAFAGAINTKTDDQTDEPVWKEGYTWTYDLDIDCEMPYVGFSLDGTIGDIHLEVLDVLNKKYKVSIDVPDQTLGTGSITIPIVETQVSGPVKSTEFSGIIFINKTDLGIIGGNIDFKGYFDKAIDVNFDLELDLEVEDYYENNAVFSTLKFPLGENKEWSIEDRLIVVHYQGSIGPVDVNDRTNDNLDPFYFWVGGYDYKCADIENKNVEAGTYESYKIQRYNYDLIPEGCLWYAPKAGAIIEMDYSDVDIGSVIFNEFELQLTDTTYNNPPTKPTQLIGPSQNNLRAGPKYTYTARGSTDIDGDKIKYGFDFNSDNSVDKWSDLVSSGSQATVQYSYSSGGTHTIKARTKDERGSLSGWSDEITVTLEANEVPGIPRTPTGQQQGTMGSSYQYSSTEVTDPEGDTPIKYQFDWGDNTNSDWVSNPQASHRFKTQGVESKTYNVRIRAKDCYGAKSGWSDSVTVTMNNNRPDTPEAPTGNEEGKKDTEYTYSATTTDPDSHQVYYKFNWGDGTDSGWVGPYDSGKQGNAKHTWTSKDSYEIKVKAKDEYGLETDWSEPLIVSMPKQKTEFGIGIRNIFIKFFESSSFDFPFMQRILNLELFI